MRNIILKPWTRVCAALSLAFFASHAQAQTVTTIGGGYVSAPYQGYQDGPTLEARFNQPSGLAMDPAGKYLFVADYFNNAIRIVSSPGISGSTTATFTNTFYPAVTRGISHPISVAVDGATNIYVLNQGNGANGTLLQFNAGSLGYPSFVVTNALRLTNATALAMDGMTNLYLTVASNTVLRVTLPNTVTVVGTITNAGTCLRGIAVMDNGQLALSDGGTNSGIWLMNLNGSVSRLAGFNGLGDNPDNWPVPASFAVFNQPGNIAKAGNGMLVIADQGNDRVKLLNTVSGTVTLLYGVSSNYWGNPQTTSDKYPGWLDGASGTQAGYAESRLPFGVVVAPDGSVFAAEDYYHVLRHVTATTLTAPVPGYPSYFANPAGIAFDNADNFLFIADATNNAVDVLDLNDNSTSTFVNGLDGVQNPASVLVDTNDNIYVLNQGTTPGTGFILQFDIYGNNYGQVATGLNQPTAFTLDAYGNFIVTEQSGNVRAFGASGASTIATVNTNANVSLQGVALFDDGTIAVSDAGNDVIWTINPITKLITRLTGQIGVPGIAIGTNRFAQLNRPHQLARLGGNQIVAADYGNNRLVLVQRTGTVSTNTLNSLMASVWFGTPNDPVTTNSASFVPMISPSGIALSGSGSLYVSETHYDDIRGLNATVATPTINPGVPLPVYASPAGIALNNEGTVLYVTDPTNNTVSALNFANNQTSVLLTSGNGIYQPVDVAADSSDNVYVLNQGTGGNGSILKFDQFGNLLGTNAASLSLPTAMKMDFHGNIFITELNGLVQEFGATGSNTLASITTNANVKLQGVAVLDNGSVVVSDAGNQVLWRIPAGSTNMSAVLFTGVIGTTGTNFGGAGSAKLNAPMRLAEAFGGLLLIADSGNNRVVVADDSGTVSRALVSTNADIWFGLPIDPVTPSSPSFVPMVSPVGLALGTTTGTNGIVYTSESVYKDIRGILNTGVRPPIAPPPAPLNLAASVTFGQVTLTWSAVTGATNYNVKHSSSSGGPYTVIGTTTANTFTDPELGASTNYYVVSAVNAGGESPNSLEVVAVPLVPPPPAPRVGWFDYEGNGLTGFFTVLHPVTSVTFNNDQLLAIDPVTNGVSTYYTTDGSDPAPTNGSTPPPYQDGLGYAQPLPASAAPTLIIKAINVDSFGQVSPITTAQFVFRVANPTITGNNAAQFTVSDVTSNAVVYYTLDGTDPTNGPPSIGPVALNQTNSATLSIVITTNVLFKAQAFRNGYTPSGTSLQGFSPSDFVANAISFGFASGEASSAFIASPGQTFYAPVTLSTLPGTIMYSLQFNVVVTNAGPNPGPAVAPGAYSFQSMLVKPTIVPNVYIPIPPYMFIGNDTGPLDPSQIVSYGGGNFVSLETNDDAINLLGVGWLERAGETNLYSTTSQDLISYSLAHDDLFLQGGNRIVVGGYAFKIPGNATSNQTYQIQIGRPSATSDGIGAPGSSVYISSSTNGSTGAGGPISALKYVTVGQPKYVAGSVYPFGWFNAGDFGSSNIVNADVMQVFQSAIYELNNPPTNSDFFDAMDSCGGTYVDLGNGYLEFNTFISGPSATSPLFDGNDTSINQIAFGDGTLDVCDVYVTYRRSIDPSLTWFQRYWNNGVRVAQIVPNVSANVAGKGATRQSPVQAKTGGSGSSGASTPAQVNFTAGDAIGTAGQTVQIPINATVFGNYPLRVLMLNLTVTPLDGSPALTTPVQFNQTATVLGTPLTTDSDGNGNFSAVWLNSTNAGLTGTSTIGTLSITIPAGATGLSSYAIHFDHASGSPNGLATFPKQTMTGLITLSSRTNSYYNDGIPDSWRLRYFGTIYNALSASNACPTGDGVSNWDKYVAGVDPNVANDFPSVKTKSATPAGYSQAIHWSSVAGKQYVIQRSSSLFNGPWTPISTNTGTGTDMEFDDNSTGTTLFYRVEILPSQATQ